MREKISKLEIEGGEGQNRPRFELDDREPLPESSDVPPHCKSCGERVEHGTKVCPHCMSRDVIS